MPVSRTVEIPGESAGISLKPSTNSTHLSGRSLTPNHPAPLSGKRWENTSPKKRKPFRVKIEAKKEKP
jgi:hypothetical protein